MNAEHVYIHIGTTMITQRLLTPGPTPVPEEVLREMAKPIIHHRSPEFREIFARVNANLKYIFQTIQPVITIASSGTGGMEASFVNMFSPGDTIITVNNGKFGERWVHMPRKFGLNVIEIKIGWGKTPTVDDVVRMIQQHPEVKAVYLVHCETSTGTSLDVKTLANAIHENSDALVCVDGISAVGALEFRFDEWGIDMCATSSQKGLMLPPGLAFIALSPRAIESIRKSVMPRYYFDLGVALKSYANEDAPWTPAISLIRGADVALQMMRNEGIEIIWSRHHQTANALRAGFQSGGLKLFSDAPSDSVTTLWLPEKIEWTKFNSILRTQYGLTLGRGQEEYFGKIFRVAHIGYFDERGMEESLLLIFKALLDCGFYADLNTIILSFQRGIKAFNN
jgi:serine---pyruvate transaminase